MEEYLISLGFTNKEINKIMNAFIGDLPRIDDERKVEIAKSSVAFLKEYMSETKIKKEVLSHPSILLYTSDKLNNKISTLQTLGFTNDEIKRIITKYSRVLSRTKEDIETNLTL